ncbi:Hypothetical predicted protein [Cloeon dipterum]|uniref:Uncharacterized protein n=1 Tax=Cloeon dipterum TaxID=197152 RepID=A0A8S1DYW0_9INSE|nr:Hypothetical predicted protein [Cloeon dipterum]
MSFQKALCLICECPTADGAVLAVHVDKEKLQTWFLNVCGNELAKEILDEDTICYFCAWQAEASLQENMLLRPCPDGQSRSEPRLVIGLVATEYRFGCRRPRASKTFLWWRN